jgi:hypothetical protein
MPPLERTGFRPGIFAGLGFVLGIIALGFIGLGVGFLVGRLGRGDSRPGLASTATVVTEIQSLAQLVTVKFVLEKVIRLDDVKWYGQNRLLMLAHGIAKAGVDLRKLRPEDVSVHEGSLKVVLPKPQIFDVYLDERQTEVIERSTGVLRSFDQEMEQEARRQAVDEIRRAARAAGILQEAEDRARSQLVALGRASGFSGVEVTFRQ